MDTDGNKTRRVDLTKTTKRSRPAPSKGTQSRQKSQIRSECRAPIKGFENRKTVESLIFNKNTISNIFIDLENRHSEMAQIENFFEVVDKLTEGGQGEILKAKDRFLNREVALKTLKLSSNGDSTNKQVFLEEAKLTAQLDHPSIIPVYSVNTYQRQTPCFSMKLVSGMTLASYLEETKKLYKKHGVKKFNESMSLANRLEYFLKICNAITYAHNKHVVHRDLKPENIMIGQFHEVYVMDWGIAGILPSKYGAAHPQASLDRNPNTLFGSTGFIDPASVKNPEPHPQIDIYALGVMLYEIVTLRFGFIGNTPEKVLKNAMESRMPPVKHRISGVRIARDLIAIIEKARSSVRKNRYSSVDELANDLRRYLTNNEVSCRPDNLPRKVLRKIQQNLKLTMFLVVLVILILSGSTTYNLFKRNQEIREAKVRELALVEYQAAVARQAHGLDSQFQSIAHLLFRVADKINQATSTVNTNIEKQRLDVTPIYSSNHYDNQESLPHGTTYARAYKTQINLDYPVYKLAPGVIENQVKTEIESLFKLRHDFLSIYLSSTFHSRQDTMDQQKLKAIEEGMPIMWLYAGFEKGYLVSFPGKGGYPETYDPRVRPWYKENKTGSGIKWGAPYYDINGLGIVLPCTYALYDKNGDVYGVAAVDVTLDYLVSKLMTRKTDGAEFIREKSILDAQGRVLISTRQQNVNRKEVVLNNESLELKPYPEKELVNQILKIQSGQVIRNKRNGQYIYAFALIPSLNWYYLEEIELKRLLTHPDLRFSM